ncbi:glycosyltransferase family 9 protein [Parafilimonas sp.]|uniref:glycosyltransferase family 9 protein n=1 Tax=Parafilimonas sp. TaxID=1969739 RepID=UPI0039E35C66
MNTPAHLLVMRFSAMGDVAMTVPVVKQLLQQHPALIVTFVSDAKFSALFDDIPRLTFFGADIHGRYHGFAGLMRLFSQLKKIENITAVADLHDVLRTKLLSFLFKISGKKISVIDKGRKEKRELTRKHNKILKPLRTGFQRYADVFTALGYPVDLSIKQERVKLPVNAVVEQLLSNSHQTKIGIAPFGRHKEKTYPIDEMEKVIAALSAKDNTVFLFGGSNERTQFETWQKAYPNIINMAGRLSFKEELMLISHLDLMISMDSGNMHLAALYGVPVVSVWGATHPFAGFYGFGQDAFNAVQAELYCRPCSVFGNKPCYRGDWACMNMISPLWIIDKADV